MKQADRTIERLTARAAITDALARFARGIDRRDWQLARSAYHADAFDDHGDYKGDVDGLLANIERRHASIAHSFHFLGNCLIEFVDDVTAIVETYVIVVQSRADDADLVDQSASRYVDRFERRSGDWRIVHRTVVPEVGWQLRSQAIHGNWAVSRRDGSDPIDLVSPT